MDVDALIAPLSSQEGAEAGPDLSYSDDRTLIEAPFHSDANGDEVDERTWRDSVSRIVKQAGETRDIWLAIYLMRGGARLGDLQIVTDGAELLAGLFETLWEPVHPTLDEADFIGRKTPCDSLTRLREFLNPLRRATVFEHRQGKVSGEDLERFASEGPGAQGYAQFRAAIASDDAERAEEIKASFVAAIARYDAIRDAIKRTDDVLVAHADGSSGTNFQTTYDTLAALRSAALPYAGMAEAAPAVGAAAEVAHDFAAGAIGAVAGGGPALSGRVNSREDVVRAIDAVIDYYTAREPGHPVPVLMRRARHWVGMDFLALLDDLVPDSIDSARRVLVSKLDEPAADDGY